MASKRKRAIRKGHTSFFGFDFWNFNLVPIDLVFNSASNILTHFYQKCGCGCEKSSQN